MPLTEEQKTLLRTKAAERNVDPEALIAEAERLTQSSDAGSAAADSSAPAAKSTDKPLYMYHLPFVTVNEVRTIWLGLGPIAGGEEYAAKFAAAQTAGPAPAASTSSDPNAA